MALFCYNALLSVLDIVCDIILFFDYLLGREEITEYVLLNDTLAMEDQTNRIFGNITTQSYCLCHRYPLWTQKSCIRHRGMVYYSSWTSRGLWAWGVCVEFLSSFCPPLCSLYTSDDLVTSNLHLYQTVGCI